MIIWRATVSGTRRSFSAGGPTRRRVIVATISSRLLRPTSWRRFSRGRPELFRHVLQVDPNAIPRRRAPPHLIHQHVGRLEQFGDLGIAFLPFRESRQRFLLILSATDLDQRELRDPRSGARLRGLHPRRLAGLLAIVRRPRRIAQPFLLLSGR